MIQDSVVAIVPEELIGEILPAVHRAGLGHLARMIRARKGKPVLEQLQRAGAPVAQAPERVAASDAVLYIAAAARSPMAGLLLLQKGATLVWIVSGRGAWSELDDLVIAVPSLQVVTSQPPQQVPGRSHHQPVNRVPPAGGAPVSDGAPLYLRESPAPQDGGTAD